MKRPARAAILAGLASCPWIARGKDETY